MGASRPRRPTRFTVNLFHQKKEMITEKSWRIYRDETWTTRSFSKSSFGRWHTFEDGRLGSGVVPRSADTGGWES